MISQYIKKIEGEFAAVEGDKTALLKRIAELEATVESLRKPGPATDAELRDVWDPYATNEAGLRAVYDLGLAHGRNQRKLEEFAKGPTEPPADLVEAVAKAIGKAQGDMPCAPWSDWTYAAKGALSAIQPEIDRLKGACSSGVRRIAELTRTRVVDDALIGELAAKVYHVDENVSRATYARIIQATLAALPPNLTQPVDQITGVEEGLRYRVETLEKENRRLQDDANQTFLAEILNQQHDPVRLPYVGLTKRDAERVENNLAGYSGNIVEALRIIAKALGAGGDR